MNSGVPQSVYQLDTTGMRKLTAAPHVLFPGQTWSLPGGNGKITFVGVKQWVSLSITYDPGQVPALVCGILALGGLLLSFLVRRRRVFVRAEPAAGGGSLVTVGGLARTDASGGFEDEFASLAAELAAADASAVDGGTVSGGTVNGGGGDRTGDAAGETEREPNNQSEAGA
jgi:cytochrome c biogenesis protein